MTSAARSPRPTRTKNVKPPERGGERFVAGWQGPLPPPAVLSAFDEVIPNGAERIVRMAELEQEHRHTVERVQTDSDAKAIKRGQWTGFAISAIAIGGAIATALAGHHWSISIALVSVPIASVVRVLVNGRQTS